MYIIICMCMICIYVSSQQPTAHSPQIIISIYVYICISIYVCIYVSSWQHAAHSPQFITSIYVYIFINVYICISIYVMCQQPAACSTQIIISIYVYLYMYVSSQQPGTWMVPSFFNVMIPSMNLEFSIWILTHLAQ